MTPIPAPKLAAPSDKSYILDDASADVDVRDKFAANSRSTPDDQKLEKSFEARRARMIDQNARATAVHKELAKRGLSEGQEAQFKDEKGKPIPGGVGYGMYYTPEFQFDWSKGTSVAWDIVCPVPPGGNVTTFLYLTATNRSSKGVEALIAYNGQNEIGFHVFDWARDAEDRWKHFPFSTLTDYLRMEPAGSTTVQVLPLMNVTYEQEAGHWFNEVWLQNHVADRWDLTYRFDYHSTHDEQRNAAVGYWGPIVETFQSEYLGTNPMGALNTRLARLNDAASWEPWQELSSNQSYVHTDDKGFHLNLFSANYSWVAFS